MRKFIMWLSVTVAVALAVLNLVYPFGPEPDGVYPMANRNVQWQYAGK